MWCADLRASLLGLPVEVLTKVMGHLEVQDICSLRMTSRFCRAICREATPGLRLSLYPHQVRYARLFTFLNRLRPPSLYVYTEPHCLSSCCHAANCKAVDAPERGSWRPHTAAHMEEV